MLPGLWPKQRQNQLQKQEVAKPNLVTFFAFLERRVVLKTNWPAEHILFMAKKMPKSVKKARSRQNQI
jgi:hypothetical protein